MIRVLEIQEPETTFLPLVFDSPHSGRIYPQDFDYACSYEALKQAEDNHIDTLFDHVLEYGAPLLHALFPRTYIDTNRAIDDIDEELLERPWPDRIKPTRRSHAGIGLIRRLVRPGIPVYNRPLQHHEIYHRIENYYKPYHTALQDILDKAHYNYGQVWHINCHSMPSGALSFKRTPHHLTRLPDFVIGDRDGSSSDAAFRNVIQDFLRGCGYSVSINDPYKGVEILKRHGKPAHGYHSLQLEINKGLYWDEKDGRKSKNYSILKDDLERLVKCCAAFIDDELQQSLAAD